MTQATTRARGVPRGKAASSGRTSRAGVAQAGSRKAGSRRASAARDGSVRGAGRPFAAIEETPARFMTPRIVYIVCVGILLAFGLLMVYSASSITALNQTGDAAYLFKRQLASALIGVALAVVIARQDYRLWAFKVLPALWVVVVVLLVATLALSTATNGATRWVSIAGISLQPSELAKAVVILTGANILQRYVEDSELDFKQAIKLALVGVGAPLVLILAQPDKGTAAITAAAIFVMLYLAGFPRRLLGGVLLAGVVLMAAISLRDDYSRQRILTMFDPWEDPYGTGYQLIQGFYAFGSGGLLGVGIGFSKQKYGFLPYAYNDFIFAVIGEECGLLGTLGVVAGFAVIAVAGFRIARYAPDLAGKLIAAGCTSLIVFQFLVNACGVLGMIPLSGKPLPFISYGGSSVISCLILAGLTVSVSRSSRLPETVHDRRRSQMRVAAGDGVAEAGRAAGTGSRARGASGAEGLRVLDGGRATSAQGGRRRIDLGPSASERLRGRGHDSGRR